MKLHREGEPESEDIELDIFSGGEVNAWLVRYVPEADRNPLVWEAVRKLEGMFPDSPHSATVNVNSAALFFPFPELFPAICPPSCA